MKVIFDHLLTVALIWTICANPIWCIQFVRRLTN